MVVNGWLAHNDKGSSSRHFNLLDASLPIAQRINSIIVRFLWSGVGNIRKPHLVCLDHISESVEEGG